MATITAYKLTPSDCLDVIDLMRLADFHSHPRRCRGGRFVPRGYICPICGVDESAGEKCKAPKAQAVKADLTEELNNSWPVEG